MKEAIFFFFFLNLSLIKCHILYLCNYIQISIEYLIFSIIYHNTFNKN